MNQLEIIEDLIRACGYGMNWMEQVDRARLSSATRGMLHVDMGMCSSAIFKANLFLEETKKLSAGLDNQQQQTGSLQTTIPAHPLEQDKTKTNPVLSNYGTGAGSSPTAKLPPGRSPGATVEKDT